MSIQGNPYGERYETMSEHGHWDTFDMTLEGCRMNLLHEIVSKEPFDRHMALAVRDELESLAQSKGYADEDSARSQFSGHTAEEIEDTPRLAAARESYEEDPDGEYTRSLDRSVGILRRAAATLDAEAFVIKVGAVMADARERGKAMYRDQNGGMPWENEGGQGPRP